MILRALAAAVLILGLFFLPWFLAFGLAAAAAAVFSWVFEILIAGFLAAVISDSPVWSFFLVSAVLLTGQEWLKKRLDVSKPASVLWVWAFGFLLFLLSSAIFL